MVGIEGTVDIGEDLLFLSYASEVNREDMFHVVRLLEQVDFLDDFILLDRVWCSVGDEFTVIEDEEGLADIEGEGHVVFDHEDGEVEFFLETFYGEFEGGDFVYREACSWFV